MFHPGQRFLGIVLGGRSNKISRHKWYLKIMEQATVSVSAPCNGLYAQPTGLLCAVVGGLAAAAELQGFGRFQRVWDTAAEASVGVHGVDEDCCKVNSSVFLLHVHCK